MRRKKLLVRAGLGLAAIVLLGVFVVGDYSVLKVASLYLEKEKFREEVAGMEKEQKELIEWERSIRGDSLELERLAREKLGMVKPGEKLFKAIVVEEGVEVTEQLETLKFGEDEAHSP